MAGGTRRGARESLADRTQGQGPPGGAGAQHVWVTDGGRHPGVLLEWRRAGAGWEGRAAYAVLGPLGPQLVESWLPATMLSPA